MEFIHYGHQAASTAAATTKRAGNLEIGKPTMDPKGARLAFYARSRIVNSSLPLSVFLSVSLSLPVLLLRSRAQPAITSAQTDIAWLPILVFGHVAFGTKRRR